jgi:hypothetical protein
MSLKFCRDKSARIAMQNAKAGDASGEKTYDGRLDAVELIPGLQLIT